MFKNLNAKEAEFGTVNIQFTLYPNKEQQDLLNKYFGHSRFVYNWAIDYNKQLYTSEKRSLSYTKLANMLPVLKADNATSFLKEVDATCLQQALQDYSQSFNMFLQHKAGYPTYRSKRKKETFRVVNVKGTVRLDVDKLKLGKFGWVRTKPNQKLPSGSIQSATVKRTKTGTIIATLSIRRDLPCEQFAKTGKEVGIDVGVKAFATFSDGTIIDKPEFFEI